MGFEKHDLDYAMVPAGLLVMAAYHAWLLHRIIHHPATTVIGINAINRELWVDTMMEDGTKNGVLAVQTLRNNIMASTLLASTAIALSSLIGVLVSGTTGSDAGSAPLIYGDQSRLGSSIKYFAILACFLVAFVCNVQSIRYYSHVSFLINVPSGKDVAGHYPEYVSRALNRGSYFWSLGLRAFYFSFPLFLWTFGPIPMVISCWILVFVLYFLDTARDFNRTLSLPGAATAGGDSNVEEGFSQAMVVTR